MRVCSPAMFCCCTVVQQYTRRLFDVEAGTSTICPYNAATGTTPGSSHAKRFHRHSTDSIGRPSLYHVPNNAALTTDCKTQVASYEEHSSCTSACFEYLLHSFPSAGAYFRVDVVCVCASSFGALLFTAFHRTAPRPPRPPLLPLHCICLVHWSSTSYDMKININNSRASSSLHR